MGPRQHAVLSAPLVMHEGSQITEQSCQQDNGFKVNMAIEWWGQTGGGGRVEHSVVLRCRQKDQTFLFTYLDFDGSTQVCVSLGGFPCSCPASVRPEQHTRIGRWREASEGRQLREEKVRRETSLTRPTLIRGPYSHLSRPFRLFPNSQTLPPAPVTPGCTNPQARPECPTSP